MSERNAVILSVRVDPVLREHARLEAKAAGITFSKFVERAVQQAVSKASADRAIRDSLTAEMHPSKRRIR
jgi:hypothetical protein